MWKTYQCFLVQYSEKSDRWVDIRSFILTWNLVLYFLCSGGIINCEIITYFFWNFVQFSFLRVQCYLIFIWEIYNRQTNLILYTQNGLLNVLEMYQHHIYYLWIKLLFYNNYIYMTIVKSFSQLKKIFCFL